MNVCPEWLCAIVREAERARNDSWWKDEGGRGGRRRSGRTQGGGMKRRGRMRDKVGKAEYSMRPHATLEMEKSRGRVKNAEKCLGEDGEEGAGKWKNKNRRKREDRQKDRQTEDAVA